MKSWRTLDARFREHDTIRVFVFFVLWFENHFGAAVLLVIKNTIRFRAL